MFPILKMENPTSTANRMHQLIQMKHYQSLSVVFLLTAKCYRLGKIRANHLKLQQAVVSQ